MSLSVVRWNVPFLYTVLRSGLSKILSSDCCTTFLIHQASVPFCIICTLGYQGMGSLMGSLESLPVAFPSTCVILNAADIESLSLSFAMSSHPSPYTIYCSGLHPACCTACSTVLMASILLTSDTTTLPFRSASSHSFLISVRKNTACSDKLPLSNLTDIILSVSLYFLIS